MMLGAAHKIRDAWGGAGAVVFIEASHNVTMGVTNSDVTERLKT